MRERVGIFTPVSSEGGASRLFYRVGGNGNPTANIAQALTHSARLLEYRTTQASAMSFPAALATC